MSSGRASHGTSVDGGTWTREVLEELRAARFAPLAWARLIARSRVRACLQRERHPRAHRQALALGAVGATAWLAALAAGRPGLTVVGLAWWLALVLMLDWHLGMLERDDGTALAGLGAANLVTTIRGGLVPLFPAVDRTGLLVAFAIFGALDVMDGRLARTRDEQTPLGAWLDGSLDGIAVATVVISAERLSALPPWLTVLVLVRQGLPWVAAAGAYFAMASRPPTDGLIPARIPGAVLAVGIGLALLDLRAGVAVAAVGAGASLATSIASITLAARRR